MEGDMPPRVKITKEKILETALELVRQKGCDAVNARAIAAMLGCSTQPVFSNFSTMEELEKGMLAAAYTHYLSFLEKEVENGKYQQK
jgi:AcrR family transcriptional regulator